LIEETESHMTKDRSLIIVISLRTIENSEGLPAYRRMYVSYRSANDPWGRTRMALYPSPLIPSKPR